MTTREEEIQMFNDIYIYTDNMEDSVDIEHIMYNIKLPYLSGTEEEFNQIRLAKWMKFHDIDNDVIITDGKLHKYKNSSELRRRTENDDFIEFSTYEEAKHFLIRQNDKEDLIKDELIKDELIKDELIKDDLIKKDFSQIHRTQTIIIVGSGDDIDKFIIDNNFIPMYGLFTYHTVVISCLRFIVFNDFTSLNVESTMLNFRRLAQQYSNVIIISFFPKPLCLFSTNQNTRNLLHTILIPYYSAKIRTIYELPSEPLREILETWSSKSRIDDIYSLEYILSNPEEYIIEDMSIAFKNTTLCSIS